MSAISHSKGLDVAARTRELAAVERDAVARRTDRLFAGLLAFQWVVAVGLALWLSPLSWAGTTSRTHPHVWAAVLLGLAIVAPPIWLALVRPGGAATRHAIAVGQVLTGALLIHLTGGRIETHFHVFGSLAFLAFYRDWRVLLTATAVTAADHVVRGMLWPESVYGTATGGEWRWVEHAGWVVFIDVFLVYACLHGDRDLRAASRRAAELEAARAGVEEEVRERTRSLRESEERFRAVIEQATDAIFLHSPDGTVVDANRCACECLGYAREELLGMTVPQLDPDMTPEKGRWVQDQLRSCRHADFESARRRKDGTLFPVEVRLGLIDVDGQQLGLAVVRDITARKQAEEELKRTRGQLLDAIETLDAGFVMYGADNRLLVCNSRYREMFAEASALMTPGTPYEDILRAFCRAGAHVNTGLTEDEWVAPRLAAHRAPGEPTEQRLGNRWVRISDRRTRDGGVVSLQTDVTVLKQAQESAESANRSKSEFLANMSHEIRTPMNGILGLTDLLLETDLDAEQRESLGLVKSSADALLTVINDILDFSKIEAGKLDLDPEPFGLRDAVGDTLKSLALKAHTKGLELICDVRPGVPDAVVGDAGRLRQVLVNLVGNAVKFTERGEIVVKVERMPAASDGVWVRFSVRDTGIGIPAGKLATVFDPFTQADGSTTRRYGGTGLGLTISTRLVGLMGGRIWAESEPGRGSEFHFEARFAPASMSWAVRTARPPAELRGVAVLVVDDNPTNRRVLSEMLRLWDAHTTCVDSGPAALAELRRAATVGEPYTLVLLDAMMPDMDGFTVAEHIGQEPALAGAALMMLTSADRQGDAARCRALGMAAHLIKPIKIIELHRAIGDVLLWSQKRRPAAPVVDPVAGTTRPLRVLLAEDNVVNQRVAVRLLEKEGHKVTVAAHGGEAVAAVEREAFDIVLMDVQMPEMDGFEATRKIRESEAGGSRRTPIVAMTAHAMTGDRERCLAAGMDEYLAKPVRRDDLLRVLRQMTAGEPAADATADRDDGPPAFDGATALERLGGDEELFAEVAGVFRTNAPQLLGDIRRAVEGAAAADLQRSAHALKGAAGYVGGAAAAALAPRLETLGDTGDLAGAPAALRDLEREIARLTDALAAFGSTVPA